MRVTLKPNGIRSYACGRGERYLRGQIYDVADARGAELVAGGHFVAAVTPPEDPNAGTRRGWEKVLDELAAMGPGFLAQVQSLAELAKTGALAQATAMPQVVIPIKRKRGRPPKARPQQSIKVAEG